MTLESFLIVITGCYLVHVAILLFGLSRNKSEISDAAPFVSIIIAARNEEQQLASCLNSVVNQTYHKEKFEIIIANDDSHDRTQEISSDFAARYPFVKWFNVEDGGALKGKANALAQAIDRANGEIILITDADCEVPRTWIEHTARYYTHNVGLVGGITLQKAMRPFEGIQSVDWAYILGVAASTANLGSPLGSIGNNLSFRKEAYNAVGGYRSVKFSVTEDYTLVQSIIRKTPWEFRYPIDKNVLVCSQPCRSINELFRQKHRWGKGGLDMKFLGLFVMAISWGTIAAAFGMIFWNGIVQCVAALMVKSIADYVFLYNVLYRLERKEELKFFWWFELYFIIYVLLLPFIVLLAGKVKWKERIY